MPRALRSLASEGTSSPTRSVGKGGQWFDRWRSPLRAQHPYALCNLKLDPLRHTSSFPRTPQTFQRISFPKECPHKRNCPFNGTSERSIQKFLPPRWEGGSNLQKNPCSQAPRRDSGITPPLRLDAPWGDICSPVRCARRFPRLCLV